MRPGLLGNPTPACNEMDIGVRGRERAHGQANWSSSRGGRTHTCRDEDLWYLSKFEGIKIRLVEHRSRKVRASFEDINHIGTSWIHVSIAFILYLLSILVSNFATLLTYILPQFKRKHPLDDNMQIQTLFVCCFKQKKPTHFSQANSSAKDIFSKDISNFLPTHLSFNSTGISSGAAYLGLDGEFGADCPNAILVILCEAQELRMDIRHPTTADLLPQQDTSGNIA